MLRMEIHPGEGGADAVAFAHELASAIGKFADRKANTGAGGALTLDCL